MLRTGLVTSVAIVAWLGSAGPAGAAGWSAPLALPATWAEMSAGFDAAGQGTFAFTESLSATATRVAIAVRRPDGSFSEQFSLASTPGDLPGRVKVAVGPDGAAAACIIANSSFDPLTTQERRMVTYRPAGSATWEPPTPLVGFSRRSFLGAECDPVVAANGQAAVLVVQTETSPSEQPDDEDNVLLLSVHRPGGAWTSLQPVNPAIDSGEGGHLATDADGNLTVAYHHRYTEGPQRYSVRVRTRSASNGLLSAPLVLTGESTTINAGEPQLAVNASGRAALAFQLGLQLNVTTRPLASGAFDALHPVFTSATASSSSPLAAGVAPTGASTVLYGRSGPTSSGNDVVGVVRRGTSGAWTSHQSVSVLDTSPTGGAVAYLGTDAHAVFAATIGSGPSATEIFRGVPWPAFVGAPEATVDLAAPGPRQRIVQATADNAGSVVAFHSPPGTPRQFFATAYDGGPPTLISSSVPTTVPVGEVVQLRAAFADAWSAVASVTWDFGDGSAAAQGSTVTHGWAAPGPYTVSVTGRDAQGNARAQVFSLAVVRPSVAGTPPPPGAVATGDRSRPRVSITLPTCRRQLKAGACKRRRARVASWRTVRGTAADNVRVARLTVTATRRKGGRLRAKRVSGSVRRRGTAWSATFKGLATGRWRFTATATDAAGNRRSATRTVALRR